MLLQNTTKLRHGVTSQKVVLFKHIQFSSSENKESVSGRTCCYCQYRIWPLSVFLLKGMLFEASLVAWSHWCSRFCCYWTSVRGSSQVASVLDLIGGSSRSTTPSLVTRKSPTVDQGVQVNQPGSTPIKDDKKPQQQQQQQLSAQTRQMQPPHTARDGSVVPMFALLICSCLYSQFARLCFLVLQASEQDCCWPAATVSSSAAEGAGRQRTCTPQRTAVPWPTASTIHYDSIFCFAIVVRDFPLHHSALQRQCGIWGHFCSRVFQFPPSSQSASVAIII
jgi:hypothetical protein